MGKKGMPPRKRSKEEKLCDTRPHVEEPRSVQEIERKHGVRNSAASVWVKRSLEEGEDA